MKKDRIAIRDDTSCYRKTQLANRNAMSSTLHEETAPEGNPKKCDALDVAPNLQRQQKH